VGKQFILKLSHMVVNKLHYRCTGPYLYHTEQPTHGRQREGGQKIGEMENWANAANGAAFICQETIVKSDNAKLRKECFAQHSTNSLFSLLMRHVKKELNNFVSRKDQDYVYNKDEDTAVEPSFALVREELFAFCFKMKKGSR
jgi:DNA-directed RNA polymerase beta subunit